MTEEQKDCIREATYRRLGDDLNVIGVVSERDAHINTSVWATGQEITWFNLSDNDLAKLHRGIEDAMKSRGLSTYTYSEGYAKGREEAFNDAVGAINEVRE